MTSSSLPWDSGSAWYDVLTIGLGYRFVVVDDVVLGLDLQMNYQSQDPRPSPSPPHSNVYTLALVPSLGYNIDLSHTVGLLPQIEMVAQSKLAGSGAARVAVGAFAPLLFHPEGFLLGIGPEILRDVVSNFEIGTVVGVRAMIGAWF